VESLSVNVEDKEWAYWNNYVCPKYSRQTEIQFFFPLTEQIPLELDYTGCAKAPTVFGEHQSLFTTGATWATVINPQLTITPNNPVGTLSIGGVNIGLEKKPTWLQKQLHKLLGFNWKDK